KIETQQDSYKKKQYKPIKSRLQILEFLFAGYFTFGLAYFVSEELYLSIPFFLLFLFGFLYISLSSIIFKK
ncbi:MAG: hypothetical protein ACE5I1_23395, partial [bacterium]